ncbi:MAG: fibronectin type III domain-containing protein, partial [Desulfobacterales bacterium]|nr:fibronectin type III domain-containing protein [Desulfobacterales bacterium]
MKVNSTYLVLFCLGLFISDGYANPKASIILGAPTDSSIMINVLFISELPQSFYLEYGISSGNYSKQTDTVVSPKIDEPIIQKLTGLSENTRYFYRLVFDDSTSSDEYSFCTRKLPGNEFSFVVQADPHFDPRLVSHSRDQYAQIQNPPYDHDPGIWMAASQNIIDFYPTMAKDGKTCGYGDNTNDYYSNKAPDFLIDLGDTFMVEKVIANHYYSDNDIDKTNGVFDFNDVNYCYEYVRNQFFSLVAHSVPIFLVTGNHEAEMGKLWNSKDTTSKNLALWSVLSRRQFFLNPIPDGLFYTGSKTIDTFDNSIRDTWFSWKWGNSQFIILDPYWYSTKNSNQEGGWAFTLGSEQ